MCYHTDILLTFNMKSSFKLQLGRCINMRIKIHLNPSVLTADLRCHVTRTQQPDNQPCHSVQFDSTHESL